jgi:predicted ATP-grasp superfamily ATP-dependent carboligase
MLTISQIKDKLDNYLMNISSNEVIENMVIKTMFYSSLREAGVPHPFTLLPDEINIKTIEKQMSFPVYLRPAQSQLFAKRFKKKGFVAKNLQELRTLIRYIQKNKIEMMVQDIIPGPTTNGYVIRGYFDKKSSLKALIATQKIRQPRMFSNNSVKFSIPLSQIAEGIKGTVQYLKNLNYRGLFGAEYKQDPRDGEFKLLEINPRSMGGNIFPSILGANHILTAYYDILGEPVAPIFSYEYGVYGVSLLKDIPTLLRRVLTCQASSSDLEPYIRKNFWSRFSFDDPLPFFKNIHNLVISILSK